MRALPVRDPGTPDRRSARHFLIWLIARQKGSVALGILWGCCWMVAQALVPAAIGASIDGLASHRTDEFLLNCGAVLGLGAITAATGILRHRCVVANFLDASYRTIQLVTEQVSRLGHTLVRLVSTGEVISVAAADVEALGGSIDITARGTGAVAAVAVVALILLASSVPLGLIVLIGAPALTALMGLLLRPLHRRQQAYRQLQGEVSARAADIVTGLRVLRGIGGEAVFARRYAAESQDLRGTGVHVARAESYLFGAEVLLPGMFVTAATWIAAHYALHRAITPGQLVSFYAYASFLAIPMATLTEAADKVVRGLVAADRVVRILVLEPDVAEPASPRPAPGPGAALHDPVSGLTAEPGELLGIAADSADDGAGLADRIGRYGRQPLPVPTLGGVPLADLPLAEVRRAILVARGDAQLFAGPLAEQLLGSAAGTGPDGRDGGDRPADRSADIARALAVASAGDVLDALPGGAGGELAARGRTLSGGQAQRLRLARALLADPDVLILVEPTSAVDAHTEARIARGLRGARPGRTTLMVTTSPLLLDAADRVVHLRDGKVAASGTHRELLHASTAYAAVVTRGEDR
jgi:ABC-type multidrug transport system fused ATPase/permease subunit